MHTAMVAAPTPFYVYEGAAFPSPDALLACPGVKRVAPFEEPMAQFYGEVTSGSSIRLKRAHLDFQRVHLDSLACCCAFAARSRA